MNSSNASFSNVSRCIAQELIQVYFFYKTSFGIRHSAHQLFMQGFVRPNRLCLVVLNLDRNFYPPVLKQQLYGLQKIFVYLVGIQMISGLHTLYSFEQR